MLATQTLAQVRPKTMRVNFEGELPPGVYPKDMVLHLIGTIGANGGIGYAVEFTGEAIRKLPVEGRLTICNMAIEFHAKYGFVPPDDMTFDYLEGREFAPKGEAWDAAVAYWRSLATDDGAVFDHEVTIDCSQIRPQVTWGTSPQQVAAIDGHVPDPAEVLDPGARGFLEQAIDYIRLPPGTVLEGVPIDAAYIGSCTNARISDLRAAAAVLKGRKVAPGIQAICVPGSTQVKVRRQQDRELQGKLVHRAAAAVDQEVVAKFRTPTDGIIEPHRQSAIIAQTLALETLINAKDLYRYLAGPVEAAF